jgi:hypothetical protein
MRILTCLLLLLLLDAASTPLHAATYEVGPGLSLTRLGQVTWNALQPGDVVNIHGQAAHYQEMLIIGSAGTAANPITINGVPGAAGEPVIIDGNGATTDSQFTPWVSTTFIQGLGTVIVYEASYIVINNISCTGADSSNQFTNSTGTTANFGDGAAGLYILGPSNNITVNRCSIYDNGNGLFVNSNNHISSNVLVQYCRLWENGVVGSFLEHNWYSETLGLTAQFNYFGPTRNGSAGSQFKSRDVNLVFRYNYLDQGNGHVPDYQGGATAYQGNGARKMDMVDIEASALMGHTGDVNYQNTTVYGNTFINDSLQSSDCIHYGGDSGITANYRAGTLYFYDNTFEFIADQGDFYKAGIFDLPGSATVQAVNNIFHQDPRTPGGTLTALGFLCTSGNLTLGPNYASPGITDWMITVTPSGVATGGYGDASPKLIHTSNDDAGFTDLATSTLSLASGSLCIGKGVALASYVLPANNCTSEYVVALQSQARGNLQDFGAYAFNAAATTSGSTTGTTGTTGATTSGTTSGTSGTSGTTGGTTSGTSGTSGTSASSSGGSASASATGGATGSTSGATSDPSSGSGGGGHCGIGGGLGMLLAGLVWRGRRRACAAR